MGHFEDFRGEDGKWYWRLRADNGEIVAQSEGYESVENVKRGIEDAANAFQSASEGFWPADKDHSPPDAL